MGDPSAARGILLVILGIWVLARTFKGGLANAVARTTSASAKGSS